ncbi:MAG: molybdate ABC transporter substrate-binding protein [Actinomycetia bacterium]|nr:molybdate ABC transporter substrate-binding protein [Actinomycetes bacterium]
MSTIAPARALPRLTAIAAAIGILGACTSGSPLNAPTSAGAADEPANAATPATPVTPGSAPTGQDTPATPQDQLEGSITVLAAASLTDAFTQLATQLEEQHPGVSVLVSFGSSTTLAQQVFEGAEADVYASAGRTALDQLPDGFAADGGTADIAANVLEIAVPPGNPGGVSGLTDFTRSDIDTVLCAETVPCGRAADEAFATAALTPTPASREIDVKATLSKVTLGEADAAIVYQSDVVSAGAAVEGVPIPAELNVSMAYPMLWSNTDPATLAFVELVTGPPGLAALAEAGFGPP